MAPPPFMLRRNSSRRVGEREAVLQALAATDEELTAASERRRLLRKVVAALSAPFLLAEVAFAVVAWQGLMMVQNEKYQPNYLQWKVFLGLLYYCTWTYAVKSCADICLSDLAALFPALGSSSRSVPASIITTFLGYVPGMWCCSLFLAWDSLPADRRTEAFGRKVSLAGYLQLMVVLIAQAVLGIRALDRAVVRAIRLRLHDTLSTTIGLLNGCEEVVHHMRKVPFDAQELVDPDDGMVKECSICACEFDGNLQIVSTECQHLFHEECLAKWCKRHHVCPLCRCDLREGMEA